MSPTEDDLKGMEIMGDENFWKGYLFCLQSIKKIIFAEMAAPTSVFSFAKSILDEDEKAAKEIVRDLEKSQEAEQDRP
jgi:hypothetical protein